jgi:hypothetical protein
MPLTKRHSPDGAGELGGAGGYKDFAPDGAANRRAEQMTWDVLTIA